MSVIYTVTDLFVKNFKINVGVFIYFLNRIQ